MRVALMPGQYAQKQRAQDVLLRRRIGTAVRQGAIPHPLPPQLVRLQKLDEVRHRPERRHRRFRIPAHENLAPRRIHRLTGPLRTQRRIRRLPLTYGVKRLAGLILVHASK